MAVGFIGFASPAHATDPVLPADSISYAYDELGRLTAVIDPTAPTNGVAKYNYDAVGNITSIERLSSAGVSVVQLSPARGPVGAKVIVYGTGFSATPGSNTVSFNGTAATISAATKTQLHVTVPSGAATGTVSVTSPSGSASSATPFTVTPTPQAPTITSFSPAVADPGTTVTVNGSDFASALADNVAAVGQVRGRVATASASSLTFLLPPGATSGRVLVATPDGSGTSASDLFVPPRGFTAADVLATGRMAIGDTNRTVSVTNNAKIGLMVFDANAGQHVFVHIPSGTITVASVKLIDPFGIEVGSTTVGTTGGYIDTKKLPTTGTYTVLVDPVTGSGNVNLSLYEAAPSTGTIAANGQPHTITGLTQGQNALRTFTGAQNQRVFLKIDSQTSTIVMVRLLHPDGWEIASTSFAGSSGFIDTKTLPAAGTYTIELDPTGAGTGNATLTLYDVPADVSGSITPGGSSVTANLNTPGQNANYTFSGNANQRVSLRLTNSTIGLGTAYLLKPDGTALASTTFQSNGGFLDTQTLPATGTYTVKLDPYGTNTGSVSAALYDVPADDSGEITIGGPAVSMTLSTPGQNGTRTFSGSSGQSIQLVLSSVTIGTSTCCSANVSIKKPDGTNLVAPTQFGTSGKTVTTTLTASGTHTILIDPVAANTGGVTLTLSLSGGASMRAPESGTALLAGLRTDHDPEGLTSTPAGAGDGPAQLVAAKRRDDRAKGASLSGPARRTYQPASTEGWIPPSGEPSSWFSGRPRSPYELLRPLKARPGITAISGRVLRLDGLPLAGVTVRTPGAKTRTGRRGRFLLAGVSPGHRVLTVDARTANRPGARYGVYEIGVQTRQGETTVLPYTIWSPKLDTRHELRLRYPLKRDVVVTNPLIPDLEVHIPAGSEIHDRQGRLVRRIGITPVPLDRSPFPMPGRFPVYFTIQPGAAYVWPHGVEIVYPNKMHAAPGERVAFYNYDPQGRGWYVYGKGTVTKNGKQVRFDPGTRQYELTSSGLAFFAGFLGGLISGFFGGDPVDLPTGAFVLPHTDLVEKGTPQIDVSRVYRSNDTGSRAFGVGNWMTYSMVLYNAQSHSFDSAELVLADGRRIHYERISPGTGATDMVLEARATPTRFLKSRIVWNGRAFELTLTEGTVYSFGNGGLLESIRDRFGNQITIARNAGQLGDITGVYSSSGRWLRFTYTSGRVTQAEDQSGRTVAYTYDGSGRLWKVTDAKGGVTEYSYDGSGRMATIKDPRNIVWLQNAYDANGRVQSQTLADGSSTYTFAYTVDGNGNVTQLDVTDPRGAVQRSTFNSVGFPLTVTRAVGTAREQQTSYEYQSTTNLLLAETDERNRRTEYQYNAAGKLTRITKLAGTANAVSTDLTYDPTYQQLTSISDPLSHGPSFGYNSRGALTSVTDARGKQWTVTPNIAGRPVTVTDPLGKQTGYAYVLGDLATVTGPLGSVIRTFHDGVGRPVRIRDALGATSRYAYDAVDGLTSITDPAGGVTAFDRDGNGNLIKVTDARLNDTVFTYDTSDRVATRKDPLLKIKSFEYDGNGNLIKLTDRKGQVRTLQYDELNRLTFEGFKTTGPPENPSFESTVNLTYDEGNRLTQLVDSAYGTVTRTYDELDRLTSETTPEGSISYGYDNAGRGQTMTVSGQPQVSYGYNNADQLTSVTRGTLSAALTYDDASRLQSVTLPDGIVQSYGYDDAANLTDITYQRSGSTIGDLVYGNDANGLRTALGGGYARTGLPSAVASASYNAANRLTAWGGQSLSYDDEGNLTGDGTQTYTWNGRNELASLAGGGASASFAYDPLGRRSSFTLNGSQTRYLYDGDTPVQELTGAGVVRANLLLGLGTDQIYAVTDSAGTQNRLTDALGSTVALADGAGTVQTQYTYEPFGKANQTGSGGLAYQFTGRDNDQTGLQYNRARYYDPTIGRFLSEDPIDFRGGSSNLYSYVGNSPLNATDPTGTFLSSDPQSEFLAGWDIGKVIGESLRKSPEFQRCLFAGYGIAVATAPFASANPPAYVASIAYGCGFAVLLGILGDA